MENTDKIQLQVKDRIKNNITPESLGLLRLKDREYYQKEILTPLTKSGKLVLTITDKPTSPNQKYVTIQISDKEILNRHINKS